MKDRWYPTRKWDAEAAWRFEEHLPQAQHKEWCLRMQASVLVRPFPRVALELLDRYFALDKLQGHAWAYEDRAKAVCSLENFEEAADAYERALEHEAAFPEFQSQAYLELPFLIATTPISPRYERALELLELHEHRLNFPVDQFRWNAARALVLAAQSDAPGAAQAAKRALDAGLPGTPEFEHHTAAGLVGDEHEGLIIQLAALV